MSRINGHRAIQIAPMERADIPQVAEIDRLSFPIPWGAASYQYEISENKMAHFLVAVNPAADPPRFGLLARLLGRPPARQVIGYAGFWLVMDEAHIGTIAIHPQRRGQGLGEQLLVALLQAALDHGAASATLEVRVGNRVAQRLYRKYAFEEVGRRKQYYRDNKEDALLMTVKMDGAFRARLRAKYEASLAQATA